MPNASAKALVIFLAALLLLLASAASAEDFTIADFSDSIVIKKDSSFTVREKITVDFLRQRHGIYRDIPCVYNDNFGRTLPTPTKVISVTDGSGKKIKYKIARKGNVLDIRMGDPDKFVSGRQIYEITYRVQNAILYFDDHDELYWNVTGNLWDAPIEHAYAIVSIPEGGTGKEPRLACYSGYMGSSESTCSKTATGRISEFETRKRLAPSEGFTIAYGWEKGIVSPPSILKMILWKLNLCQNWVFIIPFISLFSIFYLWRTRGRDPKVRESVTVMYAPPKYNNVALNPAEVGVLIDEKLDPRDVTAAIVELAVKGYIRIEEKKEEGIIFDSVDYYLSKAKGPDDSLSPFEKKLMSDLFGSMPGRMVSDLNNSFYKNIESLKNELYGDLVKKNFFSASPDLVRKIYKWGSLGTFIAVVVILYSFSGSIGEDRIYWAAFLSGLPVYGFSRYMPAKTRAGAAAKMDIAGFEEFLNRAEKDRLLRMKDENLFSTFFPYALALKVSDNWAKAFEGIYQKQPEWYVSSGGLRSFSPSGFSRSMGSAASSISSALYSAPRSSGAGGSGGGGSSGGGFGGGGGGSW